MESNGQGRVQQVPQIPYLPLWGTDVGFAGVGLTADVIGDELVVFVSIAGGRVSPITGMDLQQHQAREFCRISRAGVLALFGVSEPALVTE